MEVLQATPERIRYWADVIQSDLKCFPSMDEAIKTLTIMAGVGMEGFYIGDTGMFCYVIVQDFLGGKVLSEVMFYIKPEFRGNLRLVKQYISTAEALAKEKSCFSIKIGGNIHFKDELFLKLLKRWGYIDDTVAKYL